MPPSIDDLRREAQRTVRNRQLYRLARDFRPVAERLAGAYGNVLPGLMAAVDGWLDALGPGYGPGDEATFAATEGLISTITRDLDVLRVAIADDLAGLERSAIEQGVRGGIASVNAGGMSVQFGRPLLEAIEAGINYVDSPAFQLRLMDLANFHGQQVRDMILTGVATGANPRLTARNIRQYFLTGRPMVDAENWARTTQMYSYRQGTRSLYERTGVEQWVWSSALDDRTCPACIAMHGTTHPVSEVLNDHHRGRCAMVPVTPRWEDLGLVGEDLSFETGPDWLARQDEVTQMRLLGPGLFEAYDRGLIEFTPETIVGTYHNEIFGEMRRRRPNYEILAQSGQLF